MQTQSERESAGTKWNHHGSKYTAECRNCGAIGNTYTMQQLRRGDDDGPFYSDMQPCHADGCEVMLCPNCDQFACEECGLSHCKSHAQTWTDGEVTLTLCPACMVRQDGPQ